MLVIDSMYYWAHPEVAATMAAYFKPNGELVEGYTEADFQAYLDQNMGTPRLQYYGHYGTR